MNDEKIRKVETEHFGEIIMLDDVEQILTIASLLTTFDASLFSFVGWRGQASLDWRIDSKAVRRLKSQFPAASSSFDSNMPTFNGLLSDYEEKLLQRARQRGHGYYYGRNLYDLELLSLVQHYGGSTRLLDFSKSLWVSLWFACTDKVDEDGLLVCLNIDRLSYSMAHLREGLTSLSIKDIISHIPNNPIVFEPLHLIPRMRN
ncbi:FRG domain-containing protein [Spirosoma soli]|uniref:FRG domain-containing protein n=2 Tax=Spirosoma soli TaxID=1770529 RepID=A0ABW5MAJ0_9BACT